MKHFFPMFCVAIAQTSIVAAGTFTPPGDITVINPNPILPKACQLKINIPPPGPSCQRVNLTLDLGQGVTPDDYKNQWPDNCFDTEAGAFVCYFKRGTDACTAKVTSHDSIAMLPPYDPPMSCVWNASGNYWILEDANGAQKAQLPLQGQPRQSVTFPLSRTTSGTVSGPYSNMPSGSETIAPGRAFSCNAEAAIMAVNKANHGNTGYHSDLAGFGPFPCAQGMCIEHDDITNESPVVRQVVPRGDGRGCGWGDNGFANAVVISSALNHYLADSPPSSTVMTLVNNHGKYVP